MTTPTPSPTPPPTHSTPPAEDHLADAATRGARSRRLAFALFLGVILLDQLTKYLVVAHLEPRTAYPVIGDIARLYLIRNPGAAFSIGTSMTALLSLVQIAAALIVLVVLGRTPAHRLHRLPAVALALIGAGAAGNAIDRILRSPGVLRGHVVDFISVGNFAIFNIADSAITIGVALYLLDALVLAPRRERAAEAGEAA